MGGGREGAGGCVGTLLFETFFAEGRSTRN